MPHVVEPATSGRARCRGCGAAIPKGQIRFGERLPNPFGDGEMTLWFHPPCAALKRPEPLLETMEAGEAVLEGREALERTARFGLAHRRLPRLNGGERAPTGRARCRGCREAIARDTWRIPLVYYEEGRFEPSGFIHARCAGAYFETTDVVDRIRHFAPELGDEDLDEIRAELAAGG